MQKRLLNAIKLGAALFTAVLCFNAQSTTSKAAFDAPYYNITTNGGEFKDEHYVLNGETIKNAFFCDGTYTYFLQADGTPMKDRLTYHPDGVKVIYFDADGHEVFDNFAHVKKSISGDEVDDLCYFGTFGELYVNVLTYNKEGTKIYYANPYGVIPRGSVFEIDPNAKNFEALADGKLYGVASADGSVNCFCKITEGVEICLGDNTGDSKPKFKQIVHTLGKDCIVNGKVNCEEYGFISKQWKLSQDKSNYYFASETKCTYPVNGMNKAYSTFDYDENGTVISSCVRIYEGTKIKQTVCTYNQDEIRYSSEEVYHYDTSGKLESSTEDCKFVGIENGNETIENVRIEYTYDESENENSAIFYATDNNGEEYITGYYTYEYVTVADKRVISKKNEYVCSHVSNPLKQEEIGNDYLAFYSDYSYDENAILVSSGYNDVDDVKEKLEWFKTYESRSMHFYMREYHWKMEMKI